MPVTSFGNLKTEKSVQKRPLTEIRPFRSGRPENDVMLTGFTAKPFVEHSKVIRAMRCRAGSGLHPDAEVILFGDEEGAAEVAASWDCGNGSG